MKKPLALMGLVFVLSLLVWTILYITSSPPIAPDGGETLVLVGIVAVLVFGVARVLGSMRSKGSKND